MNLISKVAAKKLNDRLLTQNVILQTLIDIILENGLITEKELESKIEENITDIESMINTLHKESLEIEEDVVTSGIYYGPHGEA